MVRLAFIESDWNRDRGRFEPIPRTQTDWEGLRAGRIQKIGVAAAEIGRWLPRFAEAYHSVRRQKESLPKTLAESLKAIDLQLGTIQQSPATPAFLGLMDPSHAYHTPWVYLKDLPRFLNAIATRLEKLKGTGVSKDLELDRGPADAAQDYRERIAKLENQTALTKFLARWHPCGALLEYRWMIEEYRVSIHAQKLGTRMSVSPKRIEKLQQQLDQATDPDA